MKTKFKFNTFKSNNNVKVSLQKDGKEIDSSNSSNLFDPNVKLHILLTKSNMMKKHNIKSDHLIE